MKFDENTKCITLLFSQKLYINLSIDIWSNVQRFYFKVKFDENTECMTGQKSYINLFIDISTNVQSFYFKVKFDENTKCITLLFGQKSMHLSFHQYL